MSRLTKQQLEDLRDKPHWRPSWIQPGEWKELCDLALQSLSQESVRSEALELERVARNDLIGWQGKCAELREDNEKLEACLKRIRAWDMIHEPAPGVAEPCHDAPQMRKLIDAALSPAKEQPGEQVAGMVKRLREFAERLQPNVTTVGKPETLRLVTEAAAMIEKLGHGWIPVIERLPEKSGYYLARRHGEHVSELCAHSFDAKTGKWLFGDGSDVEEFPVEHWMPLPPPPERP